MRAMHPDASARTSRRGIAVARALLKKRVAESIFTTVGSARQSHLSEYKEVVTMNDRDNAKARGRGFASMDAEKQRSIASLGGRAAHRLGTAHEFSSEEAREAGRKGGEAVSANRAHMAAIGRKGGEASHRGSAKPVEQAPLQQQPSAPRVSRDYDTVREQAPQF